MNEDHEKFLKFLDESRPAVMFVAQWFNKLGYTIGLPPTTKAKTYEEWEEHADSGDLIINMRLEVKQLSADFTGREDWPFKDFIVCAKHSFDRADPKPYMYVIVNKAMTHAGIVMGSHSGNWTVEERADGRFNGRKQLYYISQVDHVVFKELV